MSCLSASANLAERNVSQVVGFGMESVFQNFPVIVDEERALWERERRTEGSTSDKMVAAAPTPRERDKANAR